MTQPASTSRSIATLVLAFAQIATPLLPMIGIGNPVGEQSGQTQTLITPAGWAFAIWGPLYFGTIVYAIWQLFPAQRERDLVRRIGWHASGAFLGNAVWVAYTQLWGLGFPSVLIIVFTLVNLLSILRVFAGTRAYTAAERLAAVLPLSALAGWLTAATIVNIAAALNFHGIVLPGPGPLIAAAILVVGGVIVSAALVGTGGNPWYPLPFLWALFAIHQKIGSMHAEIATATLVAGFLVVVTLIGMLARAERRRRYLG
ncbi:hypothetical protein ABS767_08435 [Sphingomonas sp. ST-64]|uniref:TspO and MBR related proteins n=1 Tax=Sphingomonas plantiphila TaxID=3163295 RepID=A0ABW8YM52_9SPHN